MTVHKTSLLLKKRAVDFVIGTRVPGWNNEYILQVKITLRGVVG